MATRRRARGEVRDRGRADRHGVADNPIQAQADYAAGVPQVQQDSVEKLRCYLLQKFCMGQLFATDVVTFAWYFTQAGLAGFADLSMDPNSPWVSKNASRKVSAATELALLQKQLYTVSLPMASETGERVLVPTPVCLPHEVLVEEFLYNPAAARAAAQSLPPATWQSNAVVRDNPNAEVIPYSLFVDGAPFRAKGTSSSASVLCYYINIMGSSGRRVILTLNKERFCGEQCGCACKGRCTIAAAERALQWSAECAASGVFPQQRHDSLPFAEAHRAEVSGRPLVPGEVSAAGVRFAMLEHRADWEQYSLGCGMPWPTQERFCWVCNCVTADRYDFNNHECWTRRTHEQYVAELARCEVRVRVCKPDLELILQNLQMDMKVKGRALLRELEVHDLATDQVVVLKKRDRLEPRGDVTDIHCDISFFHQDEVTLHFWRADALVQFSFRPSLLDWPGVRLDYFALDVMHTMDLGAAARLGGHIALAVLKDGTAFGNKSTLAGLRAGMVKLNQRLRQWYLAAERRARLRGNCRVAMVSRLTLRMLFVATLRKAKAHLKAKAAECRHFLPFAVSLLTPNVVASMERRGIKGSALLAAGRSLLQVYNVMEASGRQLPAAELVGPVLSCLRSCKEARVPLIPKFHMMIHLAERADLLGNPKFSSTYIDEGTNRDVVVIVQTSRVGEFAGRTLAKLHLGLQLERRLAELAQ